METTQPSFSRIDSTFDENSTGNYDIVIQTTGRSCAYSVFDQGQGNYIALESCDIPLSGLVSQNLWMRNPFRSVHVIIENDRNTLVPAFLFDESERETYLKFSLDTREAETVRFDRLNRIGAVNIFAVDERLIQEISGTFPGCNICHLSSFLIETIWMNFKNLISGKRIFLYVRETDFNLLIFDKKQLVYSNAFHFRAPEDVVYFVIFVMEQLNLNPEEIPLTLLGNIEKGSPHFELLFRYIRQIDFAERNEALHFSPVLYPVPGHFWYSLLNPVPCGS